VPDLPIEPVLAPLTDALRAHGRAVLQAPPGAGKTTRVPLHLLQAGLVRGRILLLEPRRVAARAAAERLAEGLGETVGGRVGYRMRGESVPGSAIEVITEGVLTRLVQADPELAGVGGVIFDEFHERALQADLGLALVAEARAALRPDLLLLVMSATLDAAPVAALLGDAPVLTAAGRAHPVETRWLDVPWRRPAGRGSRFEAAVAELVLEALAVSDGGVLAFLPGRAEIARTGRALAGRLPSDVRLQELHGGLGLAAQRAVLSPMRDGRRLVLATAIAETSLTIPDIRVVVDGGRARRARHDPGSGMARLVTEPVSRAEAEQRRGRAGRTAPGWCFRLWTRGEEGALPAHPPPEIAAADLAGLALELALWGVADPAELAFLTPPPGPALAEARALLRDLEALDAAGRVTPHGRSLAALPLHPRLAHMLVRGGELGAGTAAGDLAALLEARDPMRGPGGPLPADLGSRLAALRDPATAPSDAFSREGLAALRSEARRLRRLAPEPAGHHPISTGGLLSLAYPDRIAQRRPGPAPRYLLSGGKGAVLPDDDPLAATPMLVAADLDGDPREARIRRAAVVDGAEIRELHADRLIRSRTCVWSRRERAVRAREQLTLGALVLEERPWPDAPTGAVAAALIAGIRELGLEVLPWTPAARRLAARVDWARRHGQADLPDFSAGGLAASLEDWLAPHLAGLTRIDDLASVDLASALHGAVGPAARHGLDTLAPATITAPTGRRLPVDYSGAAPAVSVRLQEMLGTTRHPTVGRDAVPLVVELLSPAGRPVQTTADLPGFWATSYADVRRDLRGRYPKHAWPEDPAAAEPTRRARPRR